MVVPRLVATCLVSAAAPVGAALGELHSARSSVETPPPLVQGLAAWQRRLPSGVVIREYVTADRTVVAVTWSGPFLPDLRELLGAYYPQLLEQQRRSSLHAPVVVRTADVVILSGGTAGAFSGRAWLPGRVADNVAAKDLP